MTLFEKDSWQETFETMRKNKLRTFLTAFSVAWGIFILVILSGAGNALSNGAQSQFAADAVNSIWIDGGVTSMSWKGLKPNREIQLTNEDYKLVRNTFAEVDHATAVYKGWGSKPLSYKKEHAGFTVRPVMPDHKDLEKVTLISGRFINETDIKSYAKVCTIGKPVEEALFRGKESALGKHIDVEGSKYMVVGVFYDKGNNDMNRIYIPLSTAQRAWNGKNNINLMWVSTGKTPLKRTEEVTAQIRNMLARRHNFDPRDMNAVGVYNGNAEFARMMGTLNGIKWFVVIISLFTLIAGMVGVGNIMMVVVKERTREIGIRKALGATPASIVGQIIMESIFITAIAGYTGLVLGVSVVELVRYFDLLDIDFMKNPEVDIEVALIATGALVVTGALAGLFPSIRAARIEPVVALREN